LASCQNTNSGGTSKFYSLHTLGHST
jgi:hypothetical protein